MNHLNLPLQNCQQFWNWFGNCREITDSNTTEDLLNIMRGRLKAADDDISSQMWKLSQVSPDKLLFYQIKEFQRKKIILLNCRRQTITIPTPNVFYHLCSINVTNFQRQQQKIKQRMMHHQKCIQQITKDRSLLHLVKVNWSANHRPEFHARG